MTTFSFLISHSEGERKIWAQKKSWTYSLWSTFHGMIATEQLRLSNTQFNSWNTPEELTDYAKLSSRGFSLASSKRGRRKSWVLSETLRGESWQKEKATVGGWKTRLSGKMYKVSWRAFVTIFVEWKSSSSKSLWNSSWDIFMLNKYESLLKLKKIVHQTAFMFLNENLSFASLFSISE